MYYLNKTKTLAMARFIKGHLDQFHSAKSSKNLEVEEGSSYNSTMSPF